MRPDDFLFNQIYKGSLKDGAVERIAHACAVKGFDDYKRGKYKNPVELIDCYQKQALKRTKQLKKAI